MAQYFLQTLKGKTSTFQKKPISPSGQGWFKAQFDTSYQVIDGATGLPPKKLSLKKKGKSLVVEVDGEVITTIRNFYGDMLREVPPTYLASDDCNIQDLGSSASKGSTRGDEILIGGTGSGSAASYSDGYVWQQGSACAPVSEKIQPVEEFNQALNQPQVEVVPQADFSAGLTQNQMIGAGIAGLGLLGLAAGGGGGGGGGGAAPSATAPSTTAASNPISISRPSGGLDVTSDSGVLGDGITSDTTPTVSGSGGTPGYLITVTMPGTGEVIRAVVAGDGTWSTTPTQAIPDRTQGNIVVTMSDANGNVSEQTLIPLTIISDLIVQGTVTGGPMFTGIGLEARDDQGNLLATTTINSDGTYSMNIDRSGTYRGPVLVTAVDNNANNPNYLDEVTGVSKSLGVNLRGLGVADSGSSAFNVLSNGNTQLTVHISILSELAVRQMLGGNAWPISVNLSNIIVANKAISSAFGIGNVDITTIAPTATNAANFNAADGISSSEKVGLALAKLSGLDALNGGNVGVSIEQLSATYTGTQFSTAGLALIDQGRLVALRALKANATTFNAGAGDNDANTILNRQLLGEAVITGQSINIDGKLMVQGTALPGSTVVITLPDGTQQSVVADASGIFSLISLNIQPTLTQPLEVRSQDALSQPVVYEPPAAPVIAANNGQLITGSGTPGSIVTIKNGNTIVGTAVVDALGYWSVAPTDSKIIQALMVTPAPMLTASAVDQNGNVSGPTEKIVDVTGIALRIPEASDGYINAQEKMNGVDIDIYLPVGAAIGDVITTIITRPDRTTFSLSSVTLTLADVALGKIIQTIPASGGGGLGVDGTYAVNSTITNGATSTSATSQSQSFVLDTQAPIVPVVNDGNGLSVNGTAEPGAMVVIQVAGVDIGTAGPVGADGNWTFIPSTPLADGAAVTALAIDAAGNRGPLSSSKNVSSSALIITGAVDNIGLSQGLLSDGAKTDDSAPLVTGTLGASLTSGQVLEVWRADGTDASNKVGLATVNGTAWSYADSGLSIANHEYIVKVVFGGAVVSESRPFNLSVIDPNATPSAPSVSIPEAPGGAADILITAAEKASDGGVPILTTVSASMNLGDVVTTIVTLPSGSTVKLTSAITQADINRGYVSQLIDANLLNVEGTYSTDTTITSSTNGKVSTAVTQTFILNALPPDAPLVSLTEAPGGADTFINAAEKASNGGAPIVITLPGNAKVGDVVTTVLTKPDGSALTLTHTIVAGDLPPSQGGSASGSGPFTITQTIASSALNIEGAWSTSTTISDISGNVSDASVGAFSLDTIAPNTPVVSSFVSSTLRPTINGAAELLSGDILTVVVNGATYTIDPSLNTQPTGITYSANSGIWTVNTATAVPTSGLLAPFIDQSTYPVVASVTDAAGNISVDISIDELVINTTLPSISIPEALHSVNASEASDGIDMVIGIPAGAVVGDTITTVVSGPNSASATLSTVLNSDMLGAGTITQTIPSAILTDANNGNWTTSTSLNSSTPVASSFKLDTIAPVAPVVSLPEALGAGDTSINLAESISSGGTSILTTLPNGSAAGDVVISIITRPDNSTFTLTNVLTQTNVNNGNISQLIPSAELTANNNGAWSTSTKIIDASGNVGASTTNSFTLDTLGPAAPSSLLVAENTNGGVTAAERDSDSGVPVTINLLNTGAAAGDVITLIVDDPTVSAPITITHILTPSEISAGFADLLVPNTDILVDGIYDLVATITDAAGNTSPSTSGSFTLDTTAPAAPGSLIAPENSNDGVNLAETISSGGVPVSVALAGSGATAPKAGDIITLTVDDPTTDAPIAINYTLTSADVLAGVASVLVPTSNIPIGGTYNLSAIFTDAAGNVSSPTVGSFVVDITAPSGQTGSLKNDVVNDTGSSASDNLTKLATPVLTGTAQANTAVSVSINGVSYTTTADASGDWSVTVTNSLPSGAYTPAITVTDAAGNSSTVNGTPFTVDVLAPITPNTAPDMTQATDSGSSGTDNITKDTTPDFSIGVLPSGISDVYLLVNGSQVAATMTTDAFGNTILTPNSALTGSPVITYQLVDAAGNISAPSPSLAVTIDTTVPSTVTPALEVASNSGLTTDTITNNTTPAITGSGSNGDTITLLDANGKVLGTAVVTGGTWSITPTEPLPEGIQNLSVNATDPAGNTGADTSLAITIDTLGPSTTTGVLTTASDSAGTLASVTIGSTSDRITNDITPTFSGSGQAGNVISLVLANGTFTTTVKVDNTWLIDTGNAMTGSLLSGSSNTYVTYASGTSLDLGLSSANAYTDNAKTFDVLIAEADVAGNESTLTLPITIDTIVTDPTINVSNGISPVTGTGEAGASVVLYQSLSLAKNDGTTSGFTSVVDSGTGPVTVTYSLATALAANHILTTSKPRDITIVSQPTSGATGTVTLNITRDAWNARTTNPIALYDSIQVGGVSSVDAAGNWSISFGSALSNGTFLTVNSVDLAGNIDPPGVQIVSVDQNTPLINPTNGQSTITGTGSPNSVVSVYNETISPHQLLGTATVNASGQWSLSLAEPLANGTIVQAKGATNILSNQVTVDNVTPNTPTVVLDAASDTGVLGDNLTSDATPTLKGTSEPFATIVIKDADGNVVATAVADSAGKWSATSSTLPTGSNVLAVVATDLSGNTSVTAANITITLDTSTPVAPANLAMLASSDSGISNSDSITNNTKPTITGTGVDGNTITLKDASGAVIGTAVVANGTWSITPSKPLAEGTQTLTATATNAAGTTGPSSNLSVTIDTVAPVTAPSITSVTDNVVGGVQNNSALTNGGSTNDDMPTLNGSGAVPNSTVTIYDGSTVLGTASTDASGNWTFTTPELSDGLHQLKVATTDLAGNISAPSAAFSITVDTQAPEVSLMSVKDDVVGILGELAVDGATNDSKPTFSGVATPGSTVTIRDGATVLGTSQADSSGVWSFTPSIALADGDHSITAVAVDLAGNTSLATDAFNFTVDTSAPTVSLVKVLDFVEGGKYGDSGSNPLSSGGITNDNTPLLSGTATAGSVVSIYDGANLLGTTTADESGAWTFTPSIGLTDGAHSLTVKAVDTAGNSSGSTVAFVLNVDTTAPTAPTVSFPEGSNGISTAEAGNGTPAGTPLTLTLPIDAKVGDVISTVVTKPDGTTVTLTGYTLLASDLPPAQGGTKTGSGPFTVTQTIASSDLSLDGSWTTSTTLTDIAGNVSAPVTGSFTLDKTAPAAPSITSATDNVSGGVLGTLASGDVTNDTTPTLVGTAEPNSTVTILDGTTVLGTAIANSLGNWTFTTPALTTQGNHSFTVTASDLAGNASSASTAFTLNLDSTPTSAPSSLTVAENANGGVNASEALSGGGVPVTISLIANGATPVSVGDTVTLVVTAPDGVTTTTIKTVLSSTGTLEVLVPSAFITADGTYNLRATVTDSAGNISNATTGSFLVDRLGPAAPTGGLASDSDTGLVGDNKTNDSTPILSGTVEAGSSVGVTVNGVAYAATVNGTSWSLQLPTALTDGPYTPIITVTDAAGNATTANGTIFIVDTTAPVIPTIASVSDNVAGGVVGNLANGSLTNDKTPTLTGTAEAGSTVAIYDGVTLLGTTTANSNGSWTYTPSALADGTHSFTVKATDTANNTSASSAAFDIKLTTSIATPTLSLASDSGSSSSDSITNDGTLNVSGLVAGATWQYSLDNGVTWLAGAGTTIELTTGTYGPDAIKVKQSDSAGNISAVGSLAGGITVDTTIASPTLVLASDTGSSSSDSITNNNVINVGNLEAGATWQYSSDGGINWTAGTGSSVSTLVDGTYAVGALQVKQTDLAGNVSSITSNTQVITVDRIGPTITATGPSDNGLGAPRDNLTITFNEAIVKGIGSIRLVNDTDGTYVDILVTDPSVTISGNTVTINPSSNLLMGKNYHVEIPSGVFTDKAGNAFVGINNSTTWNFTVPDPAISLNVISGDNLINSTENAAIINLGGVLTSIESSIVAGFVKNNITVTLTPVGGGTTVTATVTNYNSTTGAWTGTVAANTLVNTKTYDVSVQATAVISGATYTTSTAGRVVVDTTVAAPTLTLAADTGISNTDKITNNNVINVGGLEAGATWQYSLDNGVTWITGSGSTISLPSATYSLGAIKVKQTDLAGNISATTSTAAAITVDTAAPSAPTGGLKHDATNDTGASATDNITNKTTPTLTGTAEANSAVTVTINGVNYSGTADASGNWSIAVTTALPSGSYTPVITATDKAGNSTSADGIAFTVDAVAPTNTTGGLAGSSDSGTLGDNRTNDSTPTLSGTAEAGATVKVTVNGTVYTTTADVNGLWTITATTALGNATYTPSIAVTDLAGNTSTTNGTPFTIDTAAPASGTAALASVSDSGTTADNKTNDNSPVLSGAAEAGSTVEVTVNGYIYKLVAGSDGKWSLDLGAALPVGVSGGGVLPTSPITLTDGSYTPTIKVTDTAGNSTTVVNGTAFTVDTGLPAVTLTQATINNTANAVVKCTEVGTVYLVRDGVVVTDLASITSSPDNVWNSVSVVTANTNTNLPAAGLVDGTYKAYAVDAAGNLSLVSTSSVIIDTTPPKVTSIEITSQTGALNNRLNVGDEVFITITTSEPVTATLAPQVLLNIGGSLAAGATSPSGGTNVWANLVQGSGTNQLVFSYKIIAGQTDVNGISIYPSDNNWLAGTYTDVAGNALVKAGAYKALTDNPNYLVDTTVAAPVLSLAADTGTNSADRITNNTTINVSGLESGASSMYSADNGVSWTSFVGTSFTLAGGSYLANYIQVKQTDLAGNEAIGKYANALTVDTVGPSINSVAITSATGIANSTLNAGDVVSITVAMSEAVTVTTTGGKPQLALNIGGQIVYADYASGSGTTNLVFTYTIIDGLNDISGIAIDANSLSTNGGVMIDVAGNNVVLTHAAVTDNASYKVDTTPPTIEITRSGSGIIGGAGEVITFTLSESSANFVATDLTLTNGALSNFAVVAGSNNTQYTATLTPTANTSGTVKVEARAAIFSDAAGNTNTDTSLAGASYEDNNLLSIQYNSLVPTQQVSFNSMTKDTSVSVTANTNADWATGDSSAGRLVSGTLNAPLIAGQVLQVFSNGTLIGNAVMAADKKSWAMTDLNGYSSNWTYSAKVVSATGTSGTVASRVVTLDAVDAAPVITAVTTANEYVPNGGATVQPLLSVTGTGINGNTIYLYNNNGSNLVGTATVASGVWSITGLASNSAINNTSNTFAAVQVDAYGNQSVASNLWSVVSPTTNLLANGDFSQGYTGFSWANVTKVSSIVFTDTTTTSAVQTASFAAGTLSSSTSGSVSGVAWNKTLMTNNVAMSGNTNNMLVANLAGQAAESTLWLQQINVVAGNAYTFAMDYHVNVAGNGTFKFVIDGVTVNIIAASASEIGHFTATYTASTSKTINLSLLGRNLFTAGSSSYGDFFIDNLIFAEKRDISGNTLIASQPVPGTSSADANLVYSSGVSNAAAGNDIITTSSTDLQTKLTSGGRIDGGAGIDTLKLAAGTTLDLTALTINQTVKQIEEIEIIEMQGASQLTLNANDVLSLGGANLSTMSAYSFNATTGGAGSTSSVGKVQMVIKGLASDELVLKSLATDGITTNTLLGNAGLAGEWRFMGTATANGQTYKIYDHSTTGAQLLVDESIAVNSNGLAFTSMTKDTAISTDTSTTNWTTLDLSAGRLLSGTLGTPLLAGEVVKVYRTVNGIATEVGMATVNDQGTAWAITDASGYSSNWSYTAKVVNSVSGIVASEAIQEVTKSTAQAVTPAAPVITSVADSLSATLANGSSTINSLASVSGTGVAGSTIALYDNSRNNLVGTAIVAANGTWSIAGLASNPAVSNAINMNNANTFSAVQIDASGNQSVLSNLWSVTSGASNLVTNGAFTSDASGWTTGFTGSGSAPTTYFTAGSPLGSLVFNAGDKPAGGWASQSLATAIGQKYSVSLSAVTPQGLTTHTVKIEVLDGANVLSSVTELITSTTPKQIRFDFTAASATSTIRITNTAVINTLSTDLWIDNVAVTLQSNAFATDLTASSVLQGTPGVDSYSYDGWVIDTLAGNDTITATSSNLQTTLSGSGRISGGAGVDTLKLAPSTILDLTALTTNQTVKQIREVEIFQMQGSSKLTLNANDVLSLGGANLSGYSFANTTGGLASTGSTDKVQMVVTGTATDSLVLKNLAQDGVTSNGIQGNNGLAGHWIFMGSTMIGGVSYEVYNHSTSNAQLLTNLDVTTESPRLSFTSMTKDTAFTPDATAPANANWITGDLSAGRLVSGVLTSPLAVDETLKVYRAVNGVATALGSAVFNTAGTSWAVTDVEGYAGNWTYFATIEKNGQIVSETSQAIMTDLAEAAPVITAVSNGSNLTSGAGDQINLTASGLPVTSVSGTGVAGNTIYIYQNTSGNLLGTATVAPNGTWSLTGFTIDGKGRHELIAMQVDPAGNVSPFSNKHTVQVDINLTANGDFSGGFTSVLTDFAATQKITAATGDSTNASGLWYINNNAYDVDNTFTAVAKVSGATNLAASGSATDGKAGNRIGSNGVLSWSSDYGNVFAQGQTQYDNPDGAMSGNAFMGNMHSSAGYGAIWKQSLNIIAGRTYVLTVDYMQNAAAPVVIFGDVFAQFNTGQYEFGHLTATFTATQTGTIFYGIGAKGFGSGAASNGGDIAIDNIKLVRLATTQPDGSLVPGDAPLAINVGNDSLNYASGIITTGLGDDVITATVTSLQTALTTSGGRINGGAGLDTLKLAAGTTLDLSNAAMTLNQTVKSIQEIEIFTLQGTSTLTMSANDVLSLGKTNAFTSNGKVQLMVNATTSDTVVLKNLLIDGVGGNTDLAGSWVKVDRLSYNNQNYDIYNHSTSEAQLWLDADAKITPTISITRSASGVILDSELITFTLSHPSTDFVATDVTVTNGALSNWTKVGVDADGFETYTAILNPTANTKGNVTVNVASNKFSYSPSSLFNADGADANNTVTASYDAILPTVAISQKVISRTQSKLTFTLSRESSDFDQSDVTFNTGALSNWTRVGVNASGQDIYTADYTYAAGIEKNLFITSGKFSDIYDRLNADGAEANNQIRFSEIVTSPGGTLYNGVDTAYAPISVLPATTIAPVEMVTNFKLSLDYYSSGGDGMSIAFGKGGYRYGVAEYGLATGIGVTIDTLSGNFGGSWLDIYDFAGGPQATPYGLIGNHHVDFEVSAGGTAYLYIDSKLALTQAITNWTTTSQTDYKFQISGRTGSDGGTLSVSNINISYNKVATGSPLTLDLNGDGVQTVSVDDGVAFDLQDHGVEQKVAWIDGNDGLLALDLNHNGMIDSGAELFGDHMSLADGSNAKDGWEALKQYDLNLDDMIDRQDDVFAQLKLWVDANVNGKTDSGELKSLVDLDIASIDLHADSHAVSQNGNILRGFSHYSTVDGQTHQMADAWLVVQQQIQLEEQLKQSASVLSA